MVLLPLKAALLDLFSSVCGPILHWNMDKSNGFSVKWHVYGQKQYFCICGFFGLSVIGRLGTVQVHYLFIIMLIPSCFT